MSTATTSTAGTFAYVPKRDSIAGGVCDYFIRDAEEELSTPDIALKFDVPQNSVASSLEQSVRSGLLSCRKSGAANVYGAGPRLLGQSGLANAPAWLQPPTRGANRPGSELARRSADLPPRKHCRCRAALPCRRRVQG
jgi:hypothetical protein